MTTKKQFLIEKSPTLLLWRDRSVKLTLSKGQLTTLLAAIGDRESISMEGQLQPTRAEHSQAASGQAVLRIESKSQGKTEVLPQNNLETLAKINPALEDAASCSNLKGMGREQFEELVMEEQKSQSVNQKTIPRPSPGKPGESL